MKKTTLKYARKISVDKSSFLISSTEKLIIIKTNIYFLKLTTCLAWFKKLTIQK